MLWAAPGTDWILLCDALFTARFVLFLLGPARRRAD